MPRLHPVLALTLGCALLFGCGSHYESWTTDDMDARETLIR